MKTTMKEYKNKVVTTTSMSKEECDIFGNAIPEQALRSMARMGIVQLTADTTQLSEGRYEVRLVFQAK